MFKYCIKIILILGLGLNLEAKTFLSLSKLKPEDQEKCLDLEKSQVGKTRKKVINFMKNHYTKQTNKSYSCVDNVKVYSKEGVSEFVCMADDSTGIVSNFFIEAKDYGDCYKKSLDLSNAIKYKDRKDDDYLTREKEKKQKRERLAKLKAEKANQKRKDEEIARKKKEQEKLKKYANSKELNIKNNFIFKVENQFGDVYIDNASYSFQYQKGIIEIISKDKTNNQINYKYKLPLHHLESIELYNYIKGNSYRNLYYHKSVYQLALKPTKKYKKREKVKGNNKPEIQDINFIPLEFESLENAVIAAKKIIDLENDIRQEEYLKKAIATVENYTPNDRLLLASNENGNLKDVKKYFNNTDKKTKEKALYNASLNGYLNIVRYLGDNGVDVNYNRQTGDTPLFWAIYKEHLDIAKYLVEKGADYNTLKEESAGDKLSMYEWALIRNNTKGLMFLKEIGAKTNLMARLKVGSVVCPTLKALNHAEYFNLTSNRGEGMSKRFYEQKLEDQGGSIAVDSTQASNIIIKGNERRDLGRVAGGVGRSFTVSGSSKKLWTMVNNFR